MKRRDLNFCKELAFLLCKPSSLEIGGVDSTLKKIIKTITVKNTEIKKKVMEICKGMIEEGYFDPYAYKTHDQEELMRMMEEDYDAVFFKD